MSRKHTLSCVIPCCISVISSLDISKADSLTDNQSQWESSGDQTEVEETQKCDDMIGRRISVDNLEANTDSKQRPIKHSICVSLRRDVHWKSLILSLLIYGCLGAIAWCRLAVITTVVVYYNRYISQKEVSNSSPCADGYIYIPIAFVILLYLVYLVECWHCHTRIELKHKVDVQTVYHKMRQMRDALPIVWWKAMCYHYVRRTRQVTRYRNGDAFTSTQVYYERVNSHTAGCAFNFMNCGITDMTKSVTGLEDFPATKIRFSKSYSFENQESKYEFDEQRNQFFVENERRDDYMETREGMDLLNVNFKEYMIAFKDPDNLPWYVSHVVFWLASCLLLTWPLRVIIEYKTAFVHYHVHKVFGNNYTASEQPSTGRMTRTNTIASAELELLVRNNFTIVPSYSEALLMGTNATSTHTLHDANANVTSPVLGPTRSITWNNMSACSSSGYINGFFTSVNLSDMQQYNSCTLVNEGIVLQSDVEQQQQGTLSNSLRSLFRSPWTRKRKRPQMLGNIGTRMFMLSSPESPEDYAITVDRNYQRSTVHVSRRISNGHDVGSPGGIAGGTGNPSSYSLVSNHSNYCQRVSVHSQPTSVVSASEGVSNNIKTLAEINVPNGTTHTSPKKVLEINDGDVAKTASLKPLVLTSPSVYSSKDDSDSLTKPMFIKSNLPNVPINTIVTDTSPSSDRPTPSSPPCYEAALNMQTLRAANRSGNNDSLSETRNLISRSERRHYYSIMETSL